ncbi:MAG: M28 family peptidase [Tannerella sp.]|jgi:Zn-dependent M28 family amino/carboxypeptidase|nr:M28 family peptidase [Tannerella sp.]
MNTFFKIILCIFIPFCCSCGQKSAKGNDAQSVSVVITNTVKSPVFDADSAYSYIERQVAFGPRVPNSQAHTSCADYLAKELERHGAKLYIQNATVTAYNGDRLNACNIIGSYNPDNKRRILLFAHWDSRPYADHDADDSNHKKPIDGADDGGSGVGVLLEIARQLGKKLPDAGIDIIFFDAEDYGTPEFVKDYKPDTWCLGSQFWAKNPHIAGYKAEFGILLDMVGAHGATFYKEYTSVRYASRYVEMVWSAARNLGYGKYFINAKGGGVTDDHVYVINDQHIPCLDIINYDPNSDSGFGAYWHTINDNMKNISKETLRAVGQTLLEVIYNN